MGCHGCEYRHEGCHISCPDGEKEAAERKARSDKINKSRNKYTEHYLFRKYQFEHQRRREK
jgi:hypothetical protein